MFWFNHFRYISIIANPTWNRIKSLLISKVRKRFIGQNIIEFLCKTKVSRVQRFLQNILFKKIFWWFAYRRLSSFFLTKQFFFDIWKRKSIRFINNQTFINEIEISTLYEEVCIRRRRSYDNFTPLIHNSNQKYCRVPLLGKNHFNNVSLFWSLSDFNSLHHI